MLTMKHRELGTVCELTLLEERLLFCTDAYDASGLEYAVESPIVLPASPVARQAAASTGSKHALSALPLLHSDPGATAKLYLDFVGAAATNWGGRSVPATPAYDQDGDPTTFTDSELASIREIFARVAEKYSPFNLDVTTEDPGQYLDGKAQRVVIGGDGHWFGSAGGVSYVGAFYNSAPNTSWVFPMMLGSGNPKYTAEAAAHEAGHAFGLDHQSIYSASGQKTDEYSPGDSQRAPIMGDSYDAARGLWWKGTSSASASTIQDDMAILAGPNNGFGYRDDHIGHTLATATPLAISGTGISGSGIITTTSDVDVFSFTTGSGQVTLNGSVINTGPTLDLKLKLYNAAGTLLTAADTASLGETITADLPAGTYTLAVASHGDYGDVGQYTISGTIVPADVITVSAPTGLSAKAAGNIVTLGWTDNAGNADACVVERSTDGTTWCTLATLGANVVQYSDTTVAAGGTYKYRVFARSGSIRSDYSGVASVTVAANPQIQPPVGEAAAPTGLAVLRRNSARVTLSWLDNATNESGFQIEYSTDGQNWTVLGRVSPGTRSVDVYGLMLNKSYSFRLKAIGPNRGSGYSNTATLSANASASKLAKTPAKQRPSLKPTAARK
ncbi:MAG: fibronectin type III domain-containing protein [Tepidisphaeraceae bacterium]